MLKSSADFFIDKTGVIERENNDCFMQTVTALKMWIDEYGDKASRTAIISAMCSIDARRQAETVFDNSLVEHVCRRQ